MLMKAEGPIERAERILLEIDDTHLGSKLLLPKQIWAKIKEGEISLAELRQLNGSSRKDDKYLDRLIYSLDETIKLAKQEV